MTQLRSGDSWDAAQYQSEARYVSDLGAPLIDLLSPGPGQRILDIGCGDGALTEKLVATGCSVVGIDSSESMVAAARSRGLDCRLLDASELIFEKEFDAHVQEVNDGSLTFFLLRRAHREGRMAIPGLQREPLPMGVRP